jgi:hypothetical protein
MEFKVNGGRTCGQNDSIENFSREQTIDNFSLTFSTFQAYHIWGEFFYRIFVKTAMGY